MAPAENNPCCAMDLECVYGAGTPEYMRILQLEAKTFRYDITSFVTCWKLS